MQNKSQSIFHGPIYTRVFVTAFREVVKKGCSLFRGRSIVVRFIYPYCSGLIHWQWSHHKIVIVLPRKDTRKGTGQIDQRPTQFGVVMGTMFSVWKLHLFKTHSFISPFLVRPSLNWGHWMIITSDRKPCDVITYPWLTWSHIRKRELAAFTNMV